MTDKDSQLAAIVAAADRAVANAQHPPTGPVKKAVIGASAVATVAVLAFIAVLYVQRDALTRSAPDERTMWEGRARALVDAKNRVLAAWDASGRLPAALTDVGPPQPLIVYTPGDTSFDFAFQRVQGDTVRVTFTRSNRVGQGRLQ